MTSTQLVLDLKLRESYSFNNFITGNNRLLIDLLQQMSSATGEQQLVIWGDEFTGKSHLLQAVCQAAAAEKLTTTYLPLKQIIQSSVEALAGLEKIDIVCVDDVQMVSQKPDWQKIEKIINEWQPDILIVGIPYYLDGSPREMTKKAERFSRQLEGRFQIPHKTINETLSSFEAEQELQKKVKISQHNKQEIDKMSAAIIVQSWLEQNS